MHCVWDSALQRMMPRMCFVQLPTNVRCLCTKSTGWWKLVCSTTNCSSRQIIIIIMLQGPLQTQ